MQKRNKRAKSLEEVIAKLQKPSETSLSESGERPVEHSAGADPDADEQFGISAKSAKLRQIFNHDSKPVKKNRRIGANFSAKKSVKDVNSKPRRKAASVTRFRGRADFTHSATVNGERTPHVNGDGLTSSHVNASPSIEATELTQIDASKKSPTAELTVPTISDSQLDKPKRKRKPAQKIWDVEVEHLVKKTKIPNAKKRSATKTAKLSDAAGSGSTADSPTANWCKKSSLATMMSALNEATLESHAGDFKVKSKKHTKKQLKCRTAPEAHETVEVAEAVKPGQKKRKQQEVNGEVKVKSRRKQKKLQDSTQTESCDINGVIIPHDDNSSTDVVNKAAKKKQRQLNSAKAVKSHGNTGPKADTQQKVKKARKPKKLATCDVMQDEPKSNGCLLNKNVSNNNGGSGSGATGVILVPIDADDSALCQSPASQLAQPPRSLQQTARDQVDLTNGPPTTDKYSPPHVHARVAALSKPVKDVYDFTDEDKSISDSDVIVDTSAGGEVGGTTEMYKMMIPPNTR